MLGETMRNFGRSIGCKARAFLSKSNNTNRSNIIVSTDRFSVSSSSMNFSRSAPFLHFSRCIHENPENMGHKVEGATKGGSSSNPLILTKESRKVKEQVRGLREGDTVDLCNLLFTKKRDYLIKCNSGQKVKAEQLEGKVVAIYFDSLLEMEEECFKSLTYIYNDLQPKNGFEVVFVDTNDCDVSKLLGTHISEGRETIENVFPTMPWPAIPLSDVRSRKHLKKKFGLTERLYIGYTFIIDPTGTIVQWEGRYIFRRYGAAGYPFNKYRINSLKSEDDEAVSQPSLNALLASRERNYLIKNNGETVPIHTLEDKVVALFFYTECDSHKDFAAKLKVAYEDLARNDEKFEVVLIYIYDSPTTIYTTSEETFSDTFKTMPWLALPFGDSNYKKLERLFFLQWEYDMMDYGLVIIGPHTEFIQPFGLTILDWFGAPAYPFTYERVAKLVTEEDKKLKLKMLWDPNSVFDGKYGSKVQLCQYAGDRVVIIFDWSGLELEGTVKFMETLRMRYYELKDTDDRFKVIHIIMGPSSSNKYVRNLPWDKVLVHDYPDTPDNFGVCGYQETGPSLLAFDRDGRIVRKTIFPTFEEKDFPFRSGDFEKETLSQLVVVFGWSHLWMSPAYKKKIYACKQARCIQVV